MAGTGAMDLGGGLGGGIGGAIAYFLEQGDRDKAMELIHSATGAYEGLKPVVNAQQAGPSAYNNISIDPNDRGTQLEAIQRLKDIYANGGLDAQARSDQYATQQASNQNAQAQQASIRNQMAARGLSSSGANFAAQRQAVQNQNNQAYAAQMQALAAGQQRQMGALQGVGQAASNLTAQDYGMAADKAGANDAIGRFNASQRQNAMQQTFNNSYQQAQGEANSRAAEAASYNKKSDDTIKAGQSMGGTVGTAAGMAFGAP